MCIAMCRCMRRRCKSALLKCRGRQQRCKPAPSGASVLLPPPFAPFVSHTLLPIYLYTCAHSQHHHTPFAQHPGASGDAVVRGAHPHGSTGHNQRRRARGRQVDLRMQRCTSTPLLFYHLTQSRILVGTGFGGSEEEAPGGGDGDAAASGEAQAASGQVARDETSADAVPAAGADGHDDAVWGGGVVAGSQSESEAGVSEATDQSHGAHAPSLAAVASGMSIGDVLALSWLRLCVDAMCTLRCLGVARGHVSVCVCHAVLHSNTCSHVLTPRCLQHQEARWLQARGSRPCELRLLVLLGIQASARAAPPPPSARTPFREPHPSCFLSAEADWENCLVGPYGVSRRRLNVSRSASKSMLRCSRAKWRVSRAALRFACMQCGVGLPVRC